MIVQRVFGYIAASRHAKARALEAKRALLKYGFGVSSDWHDIIFEGQPDPYDRAEAQRVLDRNYSAIERSDFLLALTDPRCGETYCEIRYALDFKGIRNVVWSKQNGGLVLTANDARVTLVDTDADAIEYLREFYRGAPGIC